MAVSCVSPSLRVIPAGEPTHFPAVPAERVEILFHTPDRRYVEIAHLIASHYPPSIRQALFDRLRAEAAALGADAVIVTSINHDVVETGSAGAGYVRVGSKVGYGPTASEADDVSAVAIRYPR